jgi:hypothetical protein
MPTDIPFVTLQFEPGDIIVGDKKDLREGLSAIALHGQDLWLACDEGCRLERLSQAGSGPTFSSHQSFPLAEILDLPAARVEGKPEEEADVEGMDIDDGWLWFVGSHSVKRKNPKADDPRAQISEKLLKVSRDGNRHLLARIPLDGGVPRRAAGSRRAACIDSSPKSSALLEAIEASEDPHLLPFVTLPGKDNGLDIEGLAVRGMRAFIGLRGPVLRGWSCILELRLEAQDEKLKLLPLDGAVPYRKHFQNLNNLGVRDLLIHGDDLFVLAGPTQSHDGPHEIWRWKGAAKQAGAGPSDFQQVLVLPQREKEDRAEGFTVLDGSGASTSVLVVYDTPAETRLAKKGAVTADVFRLGEASRQSAA